MRSTLSISRHLHLFRREEGVAVGDDEVGGAEHALAEGPGVLEGVGADGGTGGVTRRSEQLAMRGVWPLALPVALHQLAEPEQLVNDVNPVTPPPKKKPKTVEHIDLCTPSSSSTHTHLHLVQVGLAGPRCAVNKPLVNCSRTGRFMNRGGVRRHFGNTRKQA